MLAILAVLLSLQAAGKLTTDLYDADVNHVQSCARGAVPARGARRSGVRRGRSRSAALARERLSVRAGTPRGCHRCARRAARARRARCTFLGRVLLQHDLWALFDWLCDVRDRWHDASTSLQARLARAIRALGVDTSEAAMLPGGDRLIAHARADDLTDDLFAARGPWVLLAAEGTTEPIATVHDHHAQSRSVFGVLMRVVPEHSATLDYLATLRAFRAPLIWDGAASVEPPQLSPRLPSFPEGTSLALVRRLVHVCRAGD